MRIDPDGSAWARASSHGHWQGCRDKGCRGKWAAKSGWTRVSRGSHAGHIPSPAELDRSERTSTSEGLRLIPLETHDRRGYRPNAEGIHLPWRKDTYRDPESEGS